MSDDPTIESMLLHYLQEHHWGAGSVDRETDLIESGQLDSLVVMDLVYFVGLRFDIEMSPQEISPNNLRSVQRLARFITEKLHPDRRAA